MLACIGLYDAPGFEMPSIWNWMVPAEDAVPATVIVTSDVADVSALEASTPLVIPVIAAVGAT